MLRQFGLLPDSYVFGIAFSYIKSEEDYRAVLNLRKEASGDPTTESVDFGDFHDTASRILVGKMDGKIIASARIRFPGHDNPLLVEEIYGAALDIPSRHEIIEVDRCAISQSFSQERLTIALFRLICAACSTSKRPYVLVHAPESLQEIYESMGLMDLSRTQNSALNSVMLGDALKSMTGRHTNPFVWNFIWKDIAQHLVTAKILHPTGVDLIVLRIYQFFGPALRLISRMTDRKGVTGE